MAAGLDPSAQERLARVDPLLRISEYVLAGAFVPFNDGLVGRELASFGRPHGLEARKM